MAKHTGRAAELLAEWLRVVHVDARAWASAYWGVDVDANGLIDGAEPIELLTNQHENLVAEAVALGLISSDTENNGRNEGWTRMCVALTTLAEGN